MRDYTGGSNNYFKFELLRRPWELKKLIMRLKDVEVGL
jgi:hypothetical protein